MDFASSRPLPQRLSARADPPALAAWTLAFALVAYLALSNGGYDAVVRSQVGVAVWWIVLLGAVAGLLPARIGVAGWVAIALLGGFAAWTALGIGWSESAERSATEMARVASYLGILVLAIAAQGRTAARHTINGLACAIGLVTALAVLSRLHPQWFPDNDQIEFLKGSERRLSYPLNYWNALAALAAMGVPLLLAVALGARTLAGQAVAAATLPLSGLCIYLTISRGGALALSVGILVFVLLVPRRLDALAVLVVGGVGAAILISGASQRDALQDGVPTVKAIAEGTEILWLALIVGGGVALLAVAVGLAVRHVERPGFLAPARRATALSGLAVVVVAIVLGVAAGAPGEANDRWQEFKAQTGAVPTGSRDDVFSRLQSTYGGGRYQYWQAARHANAVDRWKGIGPGTFEFWWSRHSTAPGFIRDAHTLYFETLGEAGLVGLALLGGLFLWLLCTALVRSLRAPPGLRVWIAAATGALAAFMTAAALEWVWEMAAIAAAVMILGAVILVGRAEGAPSSPGEPANPRARVPRAILALLALAALVAVVVPLAGAVATRESRAAAADGRLSTALQASRTAERLQPYAATPNLQRALVLEEAGDLGRAATAARVATADESTNWRTWLVLARLDARRGKEAAAVRELRIARRLNPRSALFLTQ